MYQVTVQRYRLLLLGCLITASILGLALVVPRSILASEHSLEILGEAIVVQPDEENQDRMVTIITVRNNGPEVNDLSIKAVTDDGEDIQVVVNRGGTSIAAYSVAQYEIEFPEEVAETVTGRLIIEASEVVPAVQSLTLEPAPAVYSFLGIAELDASRIIASSFWFGFVLLFVTTAIAIARKLTNHKDPTKKMTFREVRSARLKGLEWDFKNNWASTFVLLSGILGGFVGASMMPEDPQILSTEGFQTLNTLFPILIVVAPFALAALNGLGKEPRKLVGGLEVGELILDGKGRIPLLILPFVAGSAIVVWAVTGELATLAVLFKELEIAGHVSAGVSRVAQVVLLILWLLGVFYAWERVVQTSLTAEKREDIIKGPDKWGPGREPVGPPVYLP